ncbi:MAG: mechanosensitive ion channel domain-containing protein [Erythrobacter sp.]
MTATPTSLPSDTTETTDPSSEPVTDDGEAAVGEDGPAPEASPTAEPEPAPEEPVEAIEATEELVEGVGAQNETAGAVLEGIQSVAIDFGSVRVSLLDLILVVGVVLLVFTGGWLLTRICGSIIQRMTGLDSTQKLLAEKLSTVAIWSVAFLVGIDALGIDLTALAFFGGAFGLAIGFGLQKTFGNLISGILLLLDKSIKPGDVISVTDQAGNESVGQIRKIGIRAISVITRDQTEHLIPNENLMINQVVNWSYSSKDVRVKAPVGVSYDSDLKLVQKLLYQAVEDTDRILNRPPPSVNIMEFGDNSVNLEVRFWIRDPEGGIANIRSDVYMRIWELFEEHKIQIPFPQRDLHLRSSEQMERLIDVISNGKQAKS